LKKRKNSFLVAALSILILWLILFVATGLTASINSFNHAGGDGFRLSVASWIVYGLPSYFFFGLIHGSLVGFPLGSEIKKSGEKSEARQSQRTA